MFGGGCEEVKDAYIKECQANAAACRDAAKAEGSIGYRAMLNDGAYLQTCGSPSTTSVKLCAAIRGGHAVGVTVTTTPGDKRLSTCIGSAIQAMAFPSSPGLDVASTVFAAQ
jgi:eukaryotic-like serine/threonine-protein kinase